MHYLAVSSVLWFLLGIIWSKSNAKNIFLKILILSLGFWGAFEFLKAAGWVVKV
jgi:hypothetical protein